MDLQVLYQQTSHKQSAESQWCQQLVIVSDSTTVELLLTLHNWICDVTIM